MQESLFNTEKPIPGSQVEPEKILLAKGQLSLYHHFLEPTRAEALLNTLLRDLPWDQPLIRIHGRMIPIPRLQVWMGDRDASYQYSGRTLQPEPWHPDILQLKVKLEAATQTQFNSVLCNLYRDGNDSVSWHSDDEPELDANNPIASYSLGATRSFDLKPKTNQFQADRVRINLTSNTLLVMPPEIQNLWVHQIPKTKKVQEPRVNLTFRRIRPQTPSA